MGSGAMVRVTLKPLGVERSVSVGVRLREMLFEQGVEFPCGGNGRCRGCRVRVLEGHLEANDVELERLTSREIADGWRLACQHEVEDNLTLELRQWDSAILADDTHFAFVPQEGLGVAVDLGTTTLAAQLLDLRNGAVLAVKTSLNPQSRFGSDLMSRVEAAVSGGQQQAMQDAIRHEIGRLIRRLLEEAQAKNEPIRQVAIVGNTVMHHLFCGIDLEPMSHTPFEPVDDGLQTFSAAELGWELYGDTVVRFLPSLGGFVGSDILAGILATGLHRSEELVGLVDLGTNGEIVIGNKDRLICASTAAGPAFEGARISQGMRASTGAIWRVVARDGEIDCETLGNAPAQGLCGSGLVDAVAVGLDLGRIGSNGKILCGDSLPLSGAVALTRTDVRQLQLAKGAIAAGIRILLDLWNAQPQDLARLYLAGAFGNYVNRASARRIGLLHFPEEQIEPAGNTALLGAKMALFADTDEISYKDIRARTEHVILSSDPRFMDIYVDEMTYPK